jgi:hypothetical protein
VPQRGRQDHQCNTDQWLGLVETFGGNKHGLVDWGLQPILFDYENCPVIGKQYCIDTTLELLLYSNLTSEPSNRAINSVLHRMGESNEWVISCCPWRIFHFHLVILSKL